MQKQRLMKIGCIGILLLFITTNLPTNTAALYTNNKSLQTPTSFEKISSLPMIPQNMPGELTDETYEQNDRQDNPPTRDVYHNYTAMTTALHTIATTYPAITRIYSLGLSVQGRTLWALKITDNPDIQEDEPEIRICGLHHGNEIMSAELPLLLAQYLTQNYGTNPTITNLVDNREIWIIPMVNPDGREANSRYNTNGVDLNRDYGYMWGWRSPGPFSQPETRVMRDNAVANNFVLSLSFHCSADKVNYVWNYKHQRSPDNPAIYALSVQYASHQGYNVTEGYDWYATPGDTNDFSYGCRGDIDWTIEVNNSNMQYTWDQNRDAMLEIITEANMGLRGIVTDATTGQPVAATVWVDQAYWPCYTDPDVGDYHKILLPGIYTVHARANGYTEQNFTVQITDENEPAILNVALQPALTAYAYQVTSCVFTDVSVYNPTEGVYALGPPDGHFASLGNAGIIVLDMGENGIIDNGPGNDFTVYEGNDGATEGYTVEVANTWNGTYYPVGPGLGTTSFDLSTCGIDHVRYIKIRDDDNPNPSGIYQGFDLDCIERIPHTYSTDVGASSISVPGQIIEGPTTLNASITNYGTTSQTNIPVTCSIYPTSGQTTLYSFDFENNNNGFFVWMPPSIWNCGVPTNPFGPKAHSGEKCWSVSLHANYTNNLNASLESIQFTLPQTTSVMLSFWQWYSFERDDAAFDGGVLEIAGNQGPWVELTPQGGYPSWINDNYNNPAFYPGQPAFAHHTSGWQQALFDLSSYAGKAIRFRFRFGSDYSITYPGWYIDDLTITVGAQPVYTATMTTNVSAFTTHSLSFPQPWNATPGMYTIVVLTALVGDQRAANDQCIQQVTVLPNSSPDTPLPPNGPTSSYLGKKLMFQAQTNDPNNDNIYYKWDFGDGTVSNWDGPHPSGGGAYMPHIYTQVGTFNIKVMAKDFYGAESNWSTALVIQVIRYEYVRADTPQEE